TVGKFEVVRIGTLQKEYTDDDVLQLAAALEQGSEHPIATGIMQKVKDLNLQPVKAENIQALTGKGISGIINQKQVQVVSPKYAKEKLGNSFSATDIRAGETLVYVLVNDGPAGFIALADQIRPESYDAIKTLHEHNIKTTLLTGDNAMVAESVSKDLGIDNYIAEVL